jgi:D-alanine-D-alanine ligase
VVFGGRSGEHEVSCRSAANVVQHLDRDRYEVLPVRITRDGVWVVGKDDPAAETVDADALLAMTPAHPMQAAVGTSIADAVAALREVDVVFPCLHGPYGEDGSLQSMFELFGLPYVGSGVLASALAMDKEFTKKVLRAEGITVADEVVLRGPHDTVADVDRARLGLPVFVKPARAGSSIGVSRVDHWDELDAALALARGSDTKVLVEPAIPGPEVAIGVLEHADGRVVTCAALQAHESSEHMFYDYQAKYEDPATVLAPADVDEATAAQLADLAVRVFRALGCAGMLRVDVFLRPGADGILPTVNEVNSLPGLTGASLFPPMWAAAGIQFPDLLDVLIGRALARGGR